MSIPGMALPLYRVGGLHGPRPSSPDSPGSQESGYDHCTRNGPAFPDRGEGHPFLLWGPEPVAGLDGQLRKRLKKMLGPFSLG